MTQPANRQGESTQSPAALRLQGELTVWRAADLREALAAVLAGGGEARIDLGEVTGADAAGLQLLCAAHRSAAEKGVRLSVNLGGAVARAAERAGLRPRVGCRAQCLWTGETP